MISAPFMGSNSDNQTKHNRFAVVVAVVLNFLPSSPVSLSRCTISPLFFYVFSSTCTLVVRLALFYFTLLHLPSFTLFLASSLLVYISACVYSFPLSRLSSSHRLNLLIVIIAWSRI